jgi:glyoxylase-like metal-dependent hydrolase (beta-lactamase superfamily II)
VAQLEQLGLRLGDIRFLSMSHSHFDHVGNAARFSQATGIVDKDKRNWMLRAAARTDEDFAHIAPFAD